MSVDNVERIRNLHVGGHDDIALRISCVDVVAVAVKRCSEEDGARANRSEGKKSAASHLPQ